MGLRGYGNSLAESFEQAALAMTAIITDPDSIRPRQTVSVHCRESDPGLLLVDWLNGIIYQMATRRMLFGRFLVSIDGDRLSGQLQGEPIDSPRHQPAVEIKGATYTELRVQRLQQQWLAQCVVDV
jgi:SHS2 domain-containing protein